MAFYASNFDPGDSGEYYYPNPDYSTGYDTALFENFSSSNYTYDFVQFQNSSSSSKNASSYGIVPFQTLSSQPPSDYTNSTYDIAPFQDPYSHSGYKYSEPGFFAFNSTSYSCDYSQYGTPSGVSYPASNFTEPKLLEYSPILHNTKYFLPDTRFVISYSNAPVLLDDTDFDTYDSTPYSGGYDITQTYGKALPPSDQICYPRSTPEANGLPSDNLSNGSIPSPVVKRENEDEKEMEKSTTPSEPIKSDSEKQQKQPSEGEGLSRDDKMEEPETEGEGSEGYSCDYQGRGGYNGNYGHGYGNKPVIEGPYGYGLEAVDLCESLFGFWPCLDKMRRKECGCEEVAVDENYLWKSAADYLFAAPYGYGGEAAAASWNW